MIECLQAEQVRHLLYLRFDGFRCPRRLVRRYEHRIHQRAPRWTFSKGSRADRVTLSHRRRFRKNARFGECLLQPR